MPDLEKHFHLKKESDADAKAAPKPLRKRKKHPVITDPLADAKTKTGLDFQNLQEAGDWKEFVTFHTTGEFSRLGKGYTQHCGPTAMTNLLCTLDKRKENPMVHSKTPAEIFEETASIGKRMLLYWNVKLLGVWGGSNAGFIYFYFRACMRRFGVKTQMAGFRLFTSPASAAKALEEGKILMLQLYHHRVYGSHLLVAYGIKRLMEPGGRIRTYLMLADGWGAYPRYLALEDIKVCGFCALKSP